MIKMKTNGKIKYFLFFILQLYCYMVASFEKRTFQLEHKVNGKIYQKDLIDFMEQNKRKINSMSIQKNAVFLLGLSGVGQSTLINYLNNVPLICKKLNNKWVIESEPINGTQVAKIGHELYSQTVLSAGYTLSGANFTYIDNPGFGETHRTLADEIANGFFTDQISANVTDLKFLLVLTDDDLRYQRGQQFRRSIKEISHLIGVFDDHIDNTSLKKISKSIGIIITKVDNDGETDTNMKIFFKKNYKKF